MDAGTAWRDYFLKWPKEMPRRGVLVTSFGEQVPLRGISHHRLAAVARAAHA